MRQDMPRRTEVAVVTGAIVLSTIPLGALATKKASQTQEQSTSGMPGEPPDGGGEGGDGSDTMSCDYSGT